MSAKRILISVSLFFLLSFAAISAAEAQRPCANILGRCVAGCNGLFGGGFWGGLMSSGCADGCGVGYIWCSVSN